MDKLDLKKELKKKEKALAAEEEELVNARADITGMRESQITQMDLVSNLQVLNNGKDVRIRTLEEENEELKVVSQEYKEKVKQMEEKEIAEKGDTKTPEKKR